MKIIADKDMFRVEEYFAGYGDLHLVPGREINANQIADADALLVRTVTRIDQSLLAGSSVRFVGSASSGIDHIDRDYLQAKGIGFFHAAGCNAEAVVNYVFAVLALLSMAKHADWRHWSVGIVGAGNVGGRLARKLENLGMDFAIYDPLLDASHPLSPQFVTLEKVLQRDVVTIHTPLTTTGPHPTWHMFDEASLAGLKNEAVLVNAARGEVLDNDMLGNFLRQRPDIRVALDVWEHEPDINLSLLDIVDIATPHIAGYSMNGKKNGTQWVHQAFCDFFNLPEPTTAKDDGFRDLLPPASSGPEIDFMNRLILAAYPIRKDCLSHDDTAFDNDIGAVFDARRNGYRFRPEFGDFRINRQRVPADLVTVMSALGFILV